MDMIKSLFSSRIIDCNRAALFLRIFMGGFMAYVHGYSKWVKWDELKVDFVEPFGMPMELAAGLTVFAELFCCALIVLGLFTRIATVPIILCMAVAAFNIHAGEPIADREGAMTYMAAFIAIFFIGPGNFSLDYLIFQSKKENVSLSK